MRKLFFVFLLLSCSLAYAYDNEKIDDFQSNIVVNQNASIDITETIRVYSTGNLINHGIVRRFPTDYRDSYGVKRHTDYLVKAVLVNGQPAPYFTKTGTDQIAIFIGDKNVTLWPGYYTYTIHYLVNKAINFLSDADELYWNITGNQWDFPILHAQANITLPSQASIINYHGYTGYAGTKGLDFSVQKPAANQISFTTTTALPPQSGLTIAVAWQKGLITAPTTPPTQYTIPVLVLLLFIYFMIVWSRYGRDSREGTIIPLFEPPLNLSPAAMRFISRMGEDQKTLTAAIVSLATKAYLSIQDLSGTFSLVKQTNTPALPPEEEAIAKELFSTSTSLTLKNSNRTEINLAESALTQSLKANYQSKYFLTNTKYFVYGVLFSLLILGAIILSAEDQHEALFAVAWISVWSVGSLILVMKAIKGIFKLFAYFTFGNLTSALFYTVFAAVFIGAEVLAAFAFTEKLPVMIIVSLIGVIALDVIFYILLKAPTVEGRKLMDQIAGFKLFLNTTERFRLEMFHAPEKTPEMFEKYLPYAIALDIENSWGKQFEDTIKAAGQDPSTYQPSWYSGNRAFTAATLSSFPAMLNSGLSSAISSASASSSSSASGGGGSSGGGGGGGGGGCW